MLMNSHPFSNYKPLPDQNILNMLNMQQEKAKQAEENNNYYRVDTYGSNPVSQEE